MIEPMITKFDKHDDLEVPWSGTDFVCKKSNSRSRG